MGLMRGVGVGEEVACEVGRWGVLWGWVVGGEDGR